jgi:hypothetical protein
LIFIIVSLFNLWPDLRPLLPTALSSVCIATKQENAIPTSCVDLDYWSTTK